MAHKWSRFTVEDNPWSRVPAQGWRSKHWEILLKPDEPGRDRALHIVSGLARSRDEASGVHSYFILYDDGTLGWDRPEAIPKYVREKAQALALEAAPGTRGYEPLGAYIRPRSRRRSQAWGSFSGRKKVKMDECYSPGVLVHLYALMEASGSVGGDVLFSGWEREATVQGRNSPWIFFRVPYRPVPEPYNWHADQARLKAMADQARAMRDLLKQRDVPAVLWCGDWGPPRAPDAPPPKGKKIKPQKAFDRAVRELKRAIKDRAEDIVWTLDDIEEEEKRLAEEEGWEPGYDEYPGFVGCLDPTTGVVYEAGIEWPQYFQGCGGPGPWNEIVSFYLDLEDPKDMLDAVEGAVSEAFDAAGVEDY